MNLMLKKGIAALLFYVIAVLLIYYYVHSIPNGPCISAAPLIMALAALLLLNILFLTVNLVKLLRGNKTNRLSVIIHLLVLLSIVAGLFYFSDPH